MFGGAIAKLQDARTALERLRALIGQPIVTNIRIISGPSGVSGDSVGIGDPVAFSEAFSSCVAQVRSVGDAVLKDQAARKLPSFERWREAKKNECKNDDLLKFINDKRNTDLHSGFCPLAFTMHTYAFSNENVGAVPFPGAPLYIDGRGPYWIVEQGTPRERQIPCELREGYVFTVAIIDPPMTHRGKPLPSSDPVTVCALAEEYYAELLFEARSKFGR
jgi:hypothetical protein